MGQEATPELEGAAAAVVPAEEPTTQVKPGLKLYDLTQFLPEMEPDAQALLEGYYGAQRFTNIRHLLTKAPGHTCLRVNRLQVKDVGVALAEVQEALKGYFDKIGAALGGSESVPQPHLFPHAPLSEDTILVPSVRLPVEPLPEGFPREEDKVVVVGRLCGEAVLRGADVFAAGVISASAGITPGTPVIILTDLDMASHRCNRGTEFRDYRGPAGFIGRGIAKYGRGVMFREKHGLAIEVTARLGWQAPPLNSLMPGRIYAQNLPSVVVGHLLSPTPGSSVIDLCAGPGGKTSHLASLMQNKGLLVACDRSRKKVLEIRRLCEESGATCVVPLVLDSSHAVTPKEQQHERHLPSSQPSALIEAAQVDKHGLRDLKAFYPETFDYVLLDPPCSALGLRPRFALDATAKALHGSADFQRNFLWTAVFLLKPGGTLVYSTCTISPLENECMVRYALDTYPCLRLVAASPKIGGEGVETAGLSDEERALVQSFDPANEELDTTGFFAAKFVKTASLFEGKEDAAEDGAGGQTAEA